MSDVYSRDVEFFTDVEQIPWLKFPSSWHVLVTGPFKGASVRFLVTLDPQSDKFVSVFADLHGNVHNDESFTGPYWETWSSVKKDTHRCKLVRTDMLMEFIAEQLKQMFPEKYEVERDE